MATRAGLSARAFHELFETAEDCYLAAFEEGLARLSHAVAEASRREQAWLGRLRSGLVALLGFLDDEPGWARLLLLDASATGGAAFGCEQRVQGVLTQLLDEGSPQTSGEPAPSPELTAELVAGGAFAVIRARVRARGGASLVELAPSLMSFMVRPYLGEAVARAELTGARAPVEPARSVALPIRATHRTTLVLRAIGAAPGSTNRQVADAAGLIDDGQASKLLARLQRHGLIENVGIGAARGEPNAWLLTGEGQRALELLGESFEGRAPRRTEHAPRRAGGRIGGVA
ncbi:MAG TPA: helix-turn-helix domain-containing protein [Solirubrobacteraceae bacterium]|nr:helix-turn-helix domain-containing protein [Solirubrobacteraceae bacterium]